MLAKPKIKILKNGLRLLMVPMEDQRTATALILVEAGSKYETKDKNGISHFLEHMCFKGTTNRPDQLTISTELETLGAEYNAFTGHEYTGYYAKVAADHLPHAIDIISDIYTNSLFKEEDIEKEKGAIVGEIAMYEDIPPRKVSDIFMQLLYGDQPAGWEIAGPKELVTTFERVDFLTYRKAHYVPEATIVVVAGKFDPKSIEQMVRERFGPVPASPKKGKKKVDDTQKAPRVLLQYKATDQTHLMLGVRSFPLGHKDHSALGVLAAVLGGGISSRLFQRVRTEMGLGYYVRAANDSFTDHGIFAAAAGVTNDKAGEAVSAIIEEFTRLKKDLVPRGELDKVKEMLAGKLVLGLESSDEHAEFYGYQEVLGQKMLTPEDAIKRMRKVEASDLRRVARSIFTTEHLNLALIGPSADTEHFKSLLKF